MKIFHDLNVKVVFLHNILTDLLLGLGMGDIFVGFAAYIKEKYGTEPGFITQNLPELKRFLGECGIDNPIICSSINKIGYLMNPDRKTYEEALKDQDFQPVAMSVFASGAIEPKEAIEYVCQKLNIKSVVFGASKKQHIVDSKNLIEKFI